MTLTRLNVSLKCCTASQSNCHNHECIYKNVQCLRNPSRESREVKYERDFISPHEAFCSFHFKKAKLISESVKMFDEGWALDLKCYFFHPQVFHLFLPETFNMLHINSTDGVGGDRPTFALQRRVIVPSLDSAVCFPHPEMIGADKKNL